MKGDGDSDGLKMGRRQFIKAAIAGLAGLAAVVAGVGAPAASKTVASSGFKPGNQSGSSNVSDHTARYFICGDHLAG